MDSITRHNFSKSFRDILTMSCRSTMIDATECLVWGMNGMSEQEILNDIVETIDACRHMNIDAERIAILEMIEEYRFSKFQAKA